MSNQKSPKLDSLLSSIRLLPPDPGIYTMLDQAGEIIYIGKAKNLKKRVSSYFLNRQDRDLKTAVLVTHICEIQTIITRSEDEALILEKQLIQQHKPRYNILLKDDKNYPYIRVSVNEPFPRITIVRQRYKDGAKYFGPYPSMGSTRHLQRILLALFPLRDCKQAIDLTTLQKKCIKLDLEQCLGPCVIKSVKPDYDQIVEELGLFLSGKRQVLLQKIESDMQQFSQAKKFEKAAKLRDSWLKLHRLMQRQIVHLPESGQAQVWVYAQNEHIQYALVQTFMEGKLLYQNGFYEEVTGLPDQSLFLERAIMHLCDPDNPGWSAADLILCDDIFYSVLDLYLKNEPKKITLKRPQRGEKHDVLLMAKRNAESALSRLILPSVHPEMGLESLQKTLALPTLPRRIWCVDISHFQGDDIVGAVVCFKDGKPDKSGYRKFLVKSVQIKSDDPRSIREVVQRRLRQVSPEDPVPDLWIIDGGKPQLNFAMSALYGAEYPDIPIVAIAKREEELFIPHRSTSIRLPRHDAGLKLVQRIRDETHRFAITFQRDRRSKSLKLNR